MQGVRIRDVAIKRGQTNLQSLLEEEILQRFDSRFILRIADQINCGRAHRLDLGRDRCGLFFGGTQFLNQILLQLG